MSIQFWIQRRQIIQKIVPDNKWVEYRMDANIINKKVREYRLHTWITEHEVIIFVEEQSTSHSYYYKIPKQSSVKPQSGEYEVGREGGKYFSFNLLKKNVANGKSTSMPSYIAWKNMNQKDALESNNVIGKLRTIIKLYLQLAPSNIRPGYLLNYRSFNCNTFYW
jgi:hypothetical protein